MTTTTRVDACVCGHLPSAHGPGHALGCMVHYGKGRRCPCTGYRLDESVRNEHLARFSMARIETEDWKDEDDDDGD